MAVRVTGLESRCKAWSAWTPGRMRGKTLDAETPKQPPEGIRLNDKRNKKATTGQKSHKRSLFCKMKSKCPACLNVSGKKNLVED